MHSRQEIIKADGEEYRKAGKKGRGKILERLVKTTGLNRDHLAARLRNFGKDGAAESGGEAGKGRRKARSAVPLNRKKLDRRGAKRGKGKFQPTVPVPVSPMPPFGSTCKEGW
jgi:hypothetical protein